MNAGATAERVLVALRSSLRAGAYRPGSRLDASTLASELASSVTPVRDALHVLAGEGLVATRPGEGFAVPAIDAPGLQDLYGWHLDVVLLALRRAADRVELPRAAPRSLADATDALFGAIAAVSDNQEHRRVVGALSDRLHAPRLVEPSVLNGGADELEALRGLAGAGHPGAFRKALTRYHRRRQRAAAAIVRALYRTP